MPSGDDAPETRLDRLRKGAQAFQPKTAAPAKKPAAPNAAKAPKSASRTAGQKKYTAQRERDEKLAAKGDPKAKAELAKIRSKISGGSTPESKDAFYTNQRRKAMRPGGDTKMAQKIAKKIGPLGALRGGAKDVMDTVRQTGPLAGVLMGVGGAARAIAGRAAGSLIPESEAMMKNVTPKAIGSGRGVRVGEGSTPASTRGLGKVARASKAARDEPVTRPKALPKPKGESPAMQHKRVTAGKPRSQQKTIRNRGENARAKGTSPRAKKRATNAGG